MDAACLEIFVAPFQSEDRGKSIPTAWVSTYEDLVLNTCIAFEKDPDKCQLEFYRHPQNIASGISAPFWNNGAFFSLARESTLQIYVSFSERVAACARDAAPLPPTTTSKRVHAAERDTANKRAKAPYKRTSFMNHTEDPPVRSSTSMNTTPTRPSYRTTSGSSYESDTSVSDSSRATSPVDWHDNINVDNSNRGSSHGKPHNRPPAGQSGSTQCRHSTPPKPEGACDVVLPFIPETRNMFQKKKDFDANSGRGGSLNLDDTYDDVREKISRHLYNSVGSGQVIVLKRYKLQVHFCVCLGTNQGGVYRMRRPLRVMEYAQDGAHLIGHIHVWLQRDGTWYDDLNSAIPDDTSLSEVAPDKLRLGILGSPQLCSPVSLSPDLDCASRFCIDPIKLRVHFKTNHDAKTKCTALERIFIGKTMGREYAGNMGSEEVRKAVLGDVLKHIRKENVNTEGIWIDFGVFFQDDTRREDFMTFEDPRQTLHQFLRKHQGAMREIHGSVVFKQRTRANCCSDFEDAVLLGCDGKRCKVKWFHPRCVGLKDFPTSLYWFCDQCRKEEIASVYTQPSQPRTDPATPDLTADEMI